MIPGFDQNGLLPPGVHTATWSEFSQRYGHTPHRERLLRGLHAAFQNLANAGCGVAYIDGSFVTAKEIPSDFDGCWEIDGVDPGLLDPVLLRFESQRAVQKAKYRGEMFPASSAAEMNPPFRTFLDFFQTDKDTGARKGIVAINLSELRS